ncbi:FIG00538327: hypothetical protein [hydrothermal vent metagenome]|uniref:Roadblock/LAMTOR2 domain-containing protein n=1 Tax=hydrothermal vent metagenome TaxID=652676 RepID=A0A3B0WK82_9ZZZZ
MSLEDVLTKAVSTVPEAVAAGYIDLSSGMLLGVKTVDSHPSEVMDLLAAATTDLFRGTNVMMIEDMFKKARGVKDTSHYFQEIIVNSENLVHIFICGKSNPEHVLTMVCRKSTNLGMALTKTRAIMPEMEKAVA